MQVFVAAEDDVCLETGHEDYTGYLPRRLDMAKAL
jgi:hypothetical protein